MSPPVARFLPARHYLSSALIAAALCVFSAAWTFRWWPSLIPAALFAATAVALYLLATRPAVEIHEHWLRIGSDMIPWQDIRRIDRTRWQAPLALYLTLVDDRRILLVYPGDDESCTSLLRFLRRNSREALIDGVPYRQFWGEVLPPSREKRPKAATASSAPPSANAPAASSPRYRIVRPEEEEEIEKMLQRLRSVGHLDPKNSDEA